MGTGLILGILILSSQPAFAVNLFTDPSFNNGVNDWSAIGHPFEGTVVNHTPPYAATNTITTVTEQEYYGQIYQIIQPYASGDLVYMEGWVKTDFAIGSTARVGVLVEFLDGSNQPIPNTAIKTELGGVNDWFRIYVTGSAPAGTAKVRAGAFIFAQRFDNAAVGGSAYVDDLFIDKIQAPGDIITNPGFEQALSGWTTGGPVYPFAITAAERHSGTYSAFDSVDSVSSQNYYGFIFQERPFSAGLHLYASAWGKTDISELAQAKGGLIIQFLNATNTVLRERKSEIGGRTGVDWRQLYVDDTAPTGTTKIRVGAFLWAGQNDNAALNGTFYIDDFAASTTPLPPPPPPSDLINPGFENGVNDWSVLFRPFVASGTVKHSGNFSAQHTIGDTNGAFDYLAEIYQEIPFSPGQTAFITGWVKTAIGPTFTANGGLKIGFYNASGGLIGTEASAFVGGNTDWRLLYTYKLAPTGTVKVRISGYAWALKNQATINGNVYIDDMTFSNNPPSELIFNPGFEDAFSGWTTDGTGFPMQVVAEEHHSGSYSAKATIELPGTADYWSRIYQEFTFSPGEILYSTLWAKTNIPPTSTASAGLKIEFLNASDVVLLSRQDIITGQTGWSYLYVSETAPSGTVKARISPFATCPRAQANLGGAAYFDDVVASRSPLPLPDFPTALSNLGFEAGLSDWTDLFGPPTQIDNVAPHSGLYSAKKTIVAIPDNDYFSIVYQDIYYNNQGAPFPADRNVWLTAYVKSNINVLAQANGGIMLQYFDASDVAHEIGKSQISAVNNWRQVYIAATIPAGAKRVRVSGFAFAIQGDANAIGGTVNFDDFVYSYTQIPAPPAHTQLLNVGFENGLNDWDNLYRPAFVTTEFVHAGSYAAKFTIDEVETDAYRGELRQEVAAQANKLVTARLWAKTVGHALSAARAGLEILFLNSSDQVLDLRTQSIGGNVDWSQLSVSAIAPSNTAKVRFAASFTAQRFDPYAAGGRAYFDDASLTITNIGGGGGCFLKGTRIKLADGRHMPIEKVKVGDKVLGFGENQLQEAVVVETFSHPKVEGYFIVTTEDGQRLNATGVHPLFTGTEYKTVSDLKKGDTIVILKKSKLIKTKITSIKLQQKSADVYDLEVGNVHNYFANGCLVHNKRALVQRLEFP